MYKVYMHRLKKDNRVYIGITKQNLKKRWQRGLGYVHSTNFYNAILKYGWDNFDHIVLFKKLSKEEAEQKEMKLIELYKSNDERYGFNMTNGGFHFNMTEEQKTKISNTEKGKKLSQETKEKLSKNIRKYYETNEPTIYLHGDVYYSEEAIKKILNLNPKVNTMIGNKWALNDNHDKVGEPFGWIIVDQEKFRNAINECKQLQDEGKIDRGYAISWELYEVLNGYDIDDFIIDKKTYLVIDDETDDVDSPEQIELLNKKVRDK